MSPETILYQPLSHEVRPQSAASSLDSIFSISQLMCFILVWQVEEVMALPSAPSKALPAPATARAPRRAGDGAGGGGGNDGSRRRRNSGSKDGAAPLTPVVPVTMPGTPAPTASGAPAAPDTPGSVVAGARPPKKVANFSEKGLATLRDKLEKLNSTKWAYI